MSVGTEAPVVFECAGEKLVGILHGCDGRCSVGIVIVVGGPQYRVGSHRQFVHIARALAAAGYPVFRFDYRGMGDSNGEPRSFEAVDDDIRSAVDSLIEAEPTLNTIVLLGLCDAASASLMYCGMDQRIGGLILLNPWVRTPEGEAKSYLRHYYLQRLMQRSFWRKVFSGEFRLGQSIRGLHQHIRDARYPRKLMASERGNSRHNLSFIERMRSGIASFGNPILFLISEKDLTAQEFVEFSRGSKAWARMLKRRSVTTRTFPGADHTLSARADLRGAEACCIEWLRALE